MQPKIKVENVAVNYYTFNQGVNSIKDFFTTFPFQRLFQKKEVLHDINIEIFPGEVFGILGKNGAGKSTLLKAIAGILKPAEGKITVNGEIAPLLALGAGMEMELTGLENIKLIGSLMNYSPSEMKQRLDNILAFSELSLDELKRPVKTYSSGMISRLSFSMAVSELPDILIVDEVLAVGDRGFQQKCHDRIQEIKEQGSTIIFISHNVREMQKVCTRAACISQGKIAFTGEVDEVVRFYKELF